MLSFLENAITIVLERAEALLLTWEKKYHALWDQDKEIFMRYPLHSAHKS